MLGETLGKSGQGFASGLVVVLMLGETLGVVQEIGFVGVWNDGEELLVARLDQGCCCV
jgi:hypothetical protein